MRSRLKLCMAVTFALSAMQAQAIGLGTIEVKSRLDQPFVAEIPLTLNDPSEANQLVIRLASPEAFERVGLERANQLSANLQFSIGRNTRGEPVVRVTTPQKMHDPYVSFLLEADWGKGKMVREYTALLDPPHTASVPRRAVSAPSVAATPLPAPAPEVTPPTAASTTPQPMAPVPQTEAQVPPLPPINAAPQEPVSPPPPPIATAPQPELAPPPIAAAPQPEPMPPPAALQSMPAPVAEAPPPAPMPEPAAPTSKVTPDSVTVAHGDTLSGIAGKVRPDDVSVNRMMIALQRTNPDAFIHSNINLLKSGAVLRIPGSEQAQTLTAEEANALVHDQVESWRQNGQPVPQLQPEEGAETTVAKAPKPAAESAAKAPKTSGLAAAADKASAPEASQVAEPAAAKPAAAAPKPEATARTTTPHKPRVARLEIVPPVGNTAHGSQSGASEGGSGSELRAQLAQTKEELAVRNTEVGDLKSRVTDLEKIQKDSQSLLTMKDSQMAALQQRLAELEKKSAAAPVASASAATAPVATVTAAPAPNSSMAASVAATTSAKPEPAKPAPAAAAHPATPAPAEPVEPSTPWYLRPLVLIGGVLLVLAGILGLMLRRPRTNEPASRTRDFSNGVLAGSLASARATGDAKSSAQTQPTNSPPAPARSTITDPLPPAPAPASKPYWTGPVAPAPAAAPVAEAAPAAHDDDDWAIDDAQEPAPVAADVTKVRAAVPELDDPNQTVATKLELARAYIDIGDSDGARGMLEEVLIEGNGTQQEEAFKLLDTLDG